MISIIKVLFNRIIVFIGAFFLSLFLSFCKMQDNIRAYNFLKPLEIEDSYVIDYYQRISSDRTNYKYEIYEYSLAKDKIDDLKNKIYSDSKWQHVICEKKETEPTSTGMYYVSSYVYYRFYSPLVPKHVTNLVECPSVSLYDISKKQFVDNIDEKINEPPYYYYLIDFDESVLYFCNQIE